MPPVPPQPPEPRRIVFDEFGPGVDEVEPEVLFEVVEDPAEVEEVAPEIDVLFQVEEAKPPESVLEIFEVPAESKAKPEPKPEPKVKPKANAPTGKRRVI